METQTAPAAQPGLAVRIVRFPLVAMVIALVAVLLALAALGFAAKFAGIGAWPPVAKMAFNGIVNPLAAILVYKLVVRRLGEEPRDDLPFDRRMADAGKGVAGGALIFTAVLGVVALLGSYYISGWGGSTSLPLMFFLGGLQAAVVEELLTRGILFRFVEEFGGSWFALALTSAIFGGLHAGNPGATVLSSAAIALEAGLLLGGAYMLTRNLWLAIGLHFGWNFTQGYLWDVAVSGMGGDGLVDAHPAGNVLVSGGAFGIEASVVALALVPLVGLWFVVLAARRGNIVRPWWVRRRLGLALPA